VLKESLIRGFIFDMQVHLQSRLDMCSVYSAIHKVTTTSLAVTLWSLLPTPCCRSTIHERH